MLRKAKKLIKRIFASKREFRMLYHLPPYVSLYYNDIGLKVKSIASIRGIDAYELEDMKSGEKAYLVVFSPHALSIQYIPPEYMGESIQQYALLCGYLDSEGSRVFIGMRIPKRVKIYEVEDPKLYRIRVRKDGEEETYLIPLKISLDKQHYEVIGTLEKEIVIPVENLEILIQLLEDPIMYFEKGTASEEIRRLQKILERMFKITYLGEIGLNVSTA